VADLQVLGFLGRTEGQEELGVHAERSRLEAEADRSAVLSVSPGYTLQARRLHVRRAASSVALVWREVSRRSHAMSVSGFQ
jgi:hypothetical protein